MGTVYSTILNKTLDFLVINTDESSEDSTLSVLVLANELGPNDVLNISNTYNQTENRSFTVNVYDTNHKQSNQYTINESLFDNHVDNLGSTKYKIYTTEKNIQGNTITINILINGCIAESHCAQVQFTDVIV